MDLNDVQRRIWLEMINLLDRFQHREISLGDLTFQLEGALDAGDFRNKVALARWYELFRDLEIRNAMSGAPEDAFAEAKAMEDFLKEHLGSGAKGVE